MFKIILVKVNHQEKKMFGQTATKNKECDNKTHTLVSRAYLADQSLHEVVTGTRS